MPRTQIPSEQINDAGITRTDLNSSLPGEAVIRKVIAGNNVTLSEDGVDAGTGDVTISSTSRTRLQYYSQQNIPANSTRFLRNPANKNINMAHVPILFEEDQKLVGVTLGVKDADPDIAYTLALYSDMNTTPVLIADIAVLPLNNKMVKATGLSVSLPSSGQYGLGLRRTAGPAFESAFNKTVVTLTLEEA